MNGEWDLEVESADLDKWYKALDQENSMSVKAKIGGITFDLTPRFGDGGKLVQMKQFCVSG